MGPFLAPTRPPSECIEQGLPSWWPNRNGELDAKWLHQNCVRCHRQICNLTVRMPSALLWGDEETVRLRLRRHVANLEMTRMTASLKFPFSVRDAVDFYQVHYGPTLRAFAGLSEDGQADLRCDLEDLYSQHNIALDGTTHIEAEYLEVVGTRK